jgi:hypothetical protein
MSNEANKHESLNFFCWNANSITMKFDEIILAFEVNKIDILALNEN